MQDVVQVVPCSKPIEFVEEQHSRYIKRLSARWLLGEASPGKVLNERASCTRALKSDCCSLNS